MVLGTSALSLLDLTTGYAAFASGGIAARPYAVLEIRKTNGDLLYSRDMAEDRPPRHVFPEEKVAELNSMLSAVVKSGTGRRADLGLRRRAERPAPTRAIAMPGTSASPRTMSPACGSATTTSRR